MAKPRREYVIFGGKGGGQIVADYLSCSPEAATVLGFLNDTCSAGDTIGTYTVLGDFESWVSLPEHIVFNAPLHKVKLMWSRAALIVGLNVPDVRWGCAVHPRALVSPSATVGPGSSIGAFCELQPAVKIGRHVAIRSGAFVGHDVTVGDFSFIAVKTVVSGYTQIGEGAHIGPMTAIKENLKIGRYSVIGIGSTVINDVEDFAIVAGCPARQIGTIETNEASQ